MLGELFFLKSPNPKVINVLEFFQLLPNVNSDWSLPDRLQMLLWNYFFVKILRKLVCLRFIFALGGGDNRRQCTSSPFSESELEEWEKKTCMTVSRQTHMKITFLLFFFTHFALWLLFGNLCKRPCYTHGIAWLHYTVPFHRIGGDDVFYDCFWLKYKNK